MQKHSTKTTIVLSVIFLTLLCFSPAGATEIQLGDSFGLNIMYYGLETEDLATFELELNYDPTILQFDSYVLGDGLGDPGNPAEVSDVSLGYLGGGTIDLAAYSWLTDLDFQPDDFSLATVFFTGTGVGTSPITLSNVFFGDIDGNKLDIDELIGTSVTVINPGTGTEAVPEPSTFILLGIGLFAGAVEMRRRKKI